MTRARESSIYYIYRIHYSIYYQILVTGATVTRMIHYDAVVTIYGHRFNRWADAYSMYTVHILSVLWGRLSTVKPSASLNIPLEED